MTITLPPGCSLGLRHACIVKKSSRKKHTCGTVLRRVVATSCRTCSSGCTPGSICLNRAALGPCGRVPLSYLPAASRGAWCQPLLYHNLDAGSTYTAVRHLKPRVMDRPAKTQLEVKYKIYMHHSVVKNMSKADLFLHLLQYCSATCSSRHSLCSTVLYCSALSDNTNEAS